MAPADSRDPLIGRHLGRADRYLVEERLGGGGFGDVYRAIDTTNARPVAIKVLKKDSAMDPVAVERFWREGEKFGAIFRHPNVVEILDLGASAGSLFLVSEFVEGSTLAAHLDATGAFEIREALRIVHDVALGLKAGHAAGAVHRDLKPENVMLRHADRHVKILDFGIAKDLTARLTLTREYLGTPGYSAPEQTYGRDVDQRADVFSLGAVLYELLTGTRAFKNGKLLEMVNAVRHHDPIPPNRLNDQVTKPAAALIERMMRRKRERRMPDMAAVIAAIDEIESHSKGLTPEESGGIRAWLRRIFERS